VRRPLPPNNLDRPFSETGQDDVVVADDMYVLGWASCDRAIDIAVNTDIFFVALVGDVWVSGLPASNNFDIRVIAGVVRDIDGSRELLGLRNDASQGKVQQLRATVDRHCKT
jgi:hypothetical protein